MKICFENAKNKVLKVEISSHNAMNGCSSKHISMSSKFKFVKMQENTMIHYVECLGTFSGKKY